MKKISNCDIIKDEIKEIIYLLNDLGYICKTSELIEYTPIQIEESNKSNAFKLTKDKINSLEKKFEKKETLNYYLILIFKAIFLGPGGFVVDDFIKRKGYFKLALIIKTRGMLREIYGIIKSIELENVQLKGIFESASKFIQEELAVFALIVVDCSVKTSSICNFFKHLFSKTFKFKDELPMKEIQKLDLGVVKYDFIDILKNSSFTDGSALKIIDGHIKLVPVSINELFNSINYKDGQPFGGESSYSSKKKEVNKQNNDHKVASDNKNNKNFVIDKETSEKGKDNEKELSKNIIVNVNENKEKEYKKESIIKCNEKEKGSNSESTNEDNKTIIQENNNVYYLQENNDLENKKENNISKEEFYNIINQLKEENNEIRNELKEAKNELKEAKKDVSKNALMIEEIKYELNLVRSRDMLKAFIDYCCKSLSINLDNNYFNKAEEIKKKINVKKKNNQKFNELYDIFDNIYIKIQDGNNFAHLMYEEDEIIKEIVNITRGKTYDSQIIDSFNNYNAGNVVKQLVTNSVINFLHPEQLFAEKKKILKNVPDLNKILS